MSLIKTLKAQVQTYLEEEILFRPRPGSKELPVAVSSGSAAIPSQLLEDLKRDGMLVFPGYLRPTILERILTATTEAYLSRRSDISVTESAESAYRYIDNPLRLSPDIFSLAFDPFLVGLIEAYFQCDIFLAEADMRRVLPISMEEFARLSVKNTQGYSPCHWHYDMRGRQVKIMVYLTDVGEGDQNFSFCPTTHRHNADIPRSRTNYPMSRFPEGWPETHGYSVVECYGKAGTLMMFDTNGVHRLRRTTQSQRDSFTFYYTPGQALRSLDYDHEQAALIAPGLRRLLGGSRK